MQEEIQVLQEKYAIAMGSLMNMANMFNGLKDTPDNATLGNLRSIINAYESAMKKSLSEIILIN